MKSQKEASFILTKEKSQKKHAKQNLVINENDMIVQKQPFSITLMEFFPQDYFA